LLSSAHIQANGMGGGVRIDLGGTLALVTGGARGIGEASALALQSAGATVVIADRNGPGAAATAQRHGMTAYELDISQEDSVTRVVEAIERERGPIGALVNCAGPLQNTETPEQLSMAMWDRIVDAHLRGTYMMNRAVGLKMAARGKGVIVTIASTAGMRSTPLHAYAPAKAALISHTECLAAEWGRRGVRVNAISPGFVPTPGVQRGLSEGLLDAAALAESSALGRLVAPEEIAAAVLFLCSDLARAITGVNLPVDAGWLVATSWAAYGGLR
jgi:NAD(P)-dependent dehydrogenase (short-subunit alcohol dehydrogenase family)